MNKIKEFFVSIWGKLLIIIIFVIVIGSIVSLINNKVNKSSINELLLNKIDSLSTEYNKRNIQLDSFVSVIKTQSKNTTIIQKERVILENKYIYEKDSANIKIYDYIDSDDSAKLITFSNLIKWVP